MTAKPIVAATDGSEHSLRAVEWAAAEAVLRGAPLRIVAAAEMPPRMAAAGPSGTSLGGVSDVLRRNRDEGLEAAAARAVAAAPGLLIDTDVLVGPPAQAVTDSGSEALMLVIGSRGAGAFTALVFGSVSRYAASHAPCPVVVIRDVPPSPQQHVGVGLGDLDRSAGTLTFAFEEAALRKASLTVIHAWETPPVAISRAGESFTGPSAHHVAEEAGKQLGSFLESWRSKYPDVTVTQDVVHGHPARALVGLSARADLVVIGRHTAHAERPGPGAVRHAVLNHAHGPVVTVPST
jgi:nucleotide-binding universal stress UspA family protein